MAVDSQYNDWHNDDDLIREIPLNDNMATPAPDRDNPLGIPDDISESEMALDVTHPATDSNLQPEEEYDEGIAGAAEAIEPKRGGAVVGYDPSKDQRRRFPKV